MGADDISVFVFKLYEVHCNCETVKYKAGRASIVIKALTVNKVTSATSVQSVARHMIWSNP